MGRLNFFVVVMTGLMGLFYFTGLLETNTNLQLLNFFLDPFNFQSSSFGLAVLTTVEAVALVSAIVIGFFTSKPDLVFFVAPSIFIFNLMFDFLSVVSRVSSVNEVVGTLLFGTVFISFSLVVLDWWRKGD